LISEAIVIVPAPGEARQVIEGLFQPMHLLLILGIALLVFGPNQELEDRLDVRDAEKALANPKRIPYEEDRLSHR
jgi:hypothetical protein